MFDLDFYMKKRRRAIDAVLDREMPAPDRRPTELHRAMRYSVFSGGKRLRPILCMASAEALGGPAESAWRPAAAIELLHAYTLIHDDLPCMDNDQTRRGQPTVHVAFGESCALLAGDALQALAFAVAARTPTPRPAVVADLIGELAQAAGSTGVVGGQVEDLAAVGTAPAPETIDFIHARKTAALFRAAVRMGARVAEADPAQLAALTDYADALGVAFQITDDLLDGTPSSAGQAQEASCLQIMAPSAAREKARALIDKACAALELFNAAAAAPLQAVASRIVNRDH